MDSVVEQAKETCKCFDDLEDDILENIVYRVINYLSNFLCWQNELCSNLLLGYRKEIFELKSKIDCCNKGIQKILPFYKHGFDFDSLEVEVLIVKGIKDEIISINKNDIFYSEHLNEIRIDLSKYDLLDENCYCKKEMKIIITYKSGFEKIPDCVLDDFCYLYRAFAQKYRDDCDCASCDNLYIAPGSYATSVKESIFTTTFKIDESDIKRIVDKMFNDGFFRNIKQLSNCEYSFAGMKGWGFGVNKKC